MTENRKAFERGLAGEPELAEIRALATEAKAAGGGASSALRMAIAARLAHAGFMAPDRVGEIYDALAEGWRGESVGSAPIATLDRRAKAAPVEMWDTYWSIVHDGAAGTLDALAITSRTAALGSLLDAGFQQRVVEMSFTYPGVREIAKRPMPPLIKLDALAACPAGSVGREFHDLIVDNAFDLEVLDRDVIGLSKLPSPLDYLNTRMLQAHDLWHIVGGYETTALHEVAISAFQMAQFGHNYSAQFLAVTATISALGMAEGFPVLMDTVTSAWMHGRQTPPMIGINWEEVWTLPVEAIRQQFGITAYERPYPANLVEMARAAA